MTFSPPSSTRCCIAGGGPAGMMLALLLARSGVDVTVLEKHADFLRDFRGDTVHPSTLQVMHELGLLESFLQRPHDKAHDIRAVIGGTEAVIADFSRLRTRCRFIAMVPQWEFLGVRNLGAPIDVLWMRIIKRRTDPSGSAGRIGTGRFMAMIDRGTYWQCAYVIHKGGIEAIRERGLEAFRADVVALVPLFADRVKAQLASWDDVKLLSVSVDRLARWWKPGLLCIGDAAHAMSPIGGVGINLAIQDAVAAANVLAKPLADPEVSAQALTPLLAKVQRRRMFPTRLTQAVQVAAQNRMLSPLLESRQPPPDAVRAQASQSLAGASGAAGLRRGCGRAARACALT